MGWAWAKGSCRARSRQASRASRPLHALRFESGSRRASPAGERPCECAVWRQGGLAGQAGGRNARGVWEAVRVASAWSARPGSRRGESSVAALGRRSCCAFGPRRSEGPSNERMKLTKLSAAPFRGAKCRLMPAPSRLGAGTASQLIPGVRRLAEGQRTAGRPGVVTARSVAGRHTGCDAPTHPGSHGCMCRCAPAS